MGKSPVKFDLFANSRLILADGLGDGRFRGVVRNAGENDMVRLKSNEKKSFEFL